MSCKSSSNDDLNGNDSGAILPKKKGGKTSSSSPCSTYSIEVCQGPDCTGLGGGVAVLEIEELVREHHHRHSHTGAKNKICVVAGGCRDFCSVGPNVHILVRRQQQQRGRKKMFLLESFQNVKDASGCDRVVNDVIGHALSSAAASEGSADAKDTNENPPSSSSSSMDRHRSMMTRRAERMRWDALKDVSRTISKCNKLVTAAPPSNRGSGIDRGIERKLRIWKETCKDRIGKAETSIKTSRISQRDQRRTERLVEIASEKLDRICLRVDDESDSSSYSSGISDESDSSDE